MRKALLAAAMIAAAVTAGGVSFSGSSSFFSRFSSEESGWSRMPGEFWRWRFNPVVNVHGIPVVASVFVSSEESMQRQNINRIYISSSPSASAREESVLSFVSTIGAGAFNPFFSGLTLNAANISGANIAIQPGNFYLAAAGGRNRRAVEPEDGSPGTYHRSIYAVQTGLGSPYGSHLHLILLTGEDREGSITEDSTFRVTPSKNRVASLDWGAVLAGGRFRLEGEVAGSIHTRDTRSPEVDSDQVPDWLMDLAGVNVSSGFGWAADLSSSLRFSNNMVSLAFSRVGPGFRSMGCPYLRNDELSAEGRFDRFFMERKLYAGVYYRWERDNLLGNRSCTTTGNSWGVRAGMSFPGLPGLNLSYSPSAVEVNDTTGTRIETSMVSVSASYRRDIMDLDVNSMIAMTVHDNSMGSGSSDYGMVSGTLRETVSLEYPVVITGCLSAGRTRRGSLREWSYTGDLRGTWYPSGDFSLTAGGYWSKGESDGRQGVLAGGGFPILDWLTAEVSGEYSNYTAGSEPDVTVLSGGAGLTVIW